MFLIPLGMRVGKHRYVRAGGACSSVVLSVVSWVYNNHGSRCWWKSMAESWRGLSLERAGWGEESAGGINKSSKKKSGRKGWDLGEFATKPVLKKVVDMAEAVCLVGEPASHAITSVRCRRIWTRGASGLLGCGGDEITTGNEWYYKNERKK